MSHQVKRTKIGLRVTIYPRGKKSIYHADFHQFGKHIRLSLMTTNKKSATRRAMEIENLLEAGVDARASLSWTERRSVPTDPTPVPARKLAEAAIAEFIDFKKVEGCRAKTLVKYEGILQKILERLRSSKHSLVAEITLVFFDTYRSEQRKRLSDKSMHNETIVLKQFLAWCKSRKYIEQNPLADQKYAKPKVQRRETFLSASQIGEIIRRAEPDLRYKLAMIACTGMRSGECQRLLVEDVDFEIRWIYIRSREGQRTKTGNSWKVPMHPVLHDLLRQGKRRKSGYYFTAPRSRKNRDGLAPMNTKQLNDDFKQLLITLGITAGRKQGGFCIHDLRHAFKSLAIASGVPREYADAWQGHASVSRASDHYVHTSDENSQALIAKIPFDFDPPASDASTTI